MARHFVAGSSQYLRAASATRGTAPLTMACWMRPQLLAGTEELFTQMVAGVNQGIYLYLSTGKVVGQVYNGTVNVFIVAGTVANLNAWAHVAGVYKTGGIDVYLNGALDGSVSGDVAGTIPAVSETAIGAASTAAPGYFTGDVAEAAIWSVALDAADLLMLARGAIPALVRPEALVGYWPLLGGYSPEIDLRAGRGLTLGNSPAAAAHPPVWQAVPPHIKRTSAVSYTLSGTTRDAAGNPIAGAVVKVFRSSDDTLATQTISDGVGHYSVPVAPGVQYYLVAYKAGSPDVAGTSVNTLVGV